MAAFALNPLAPCAAGGRSGRHGLCDTTTGEPFVPRGSNYIRLADGYHSNFDAAHYNRTRYVAALRAMQAGGLNMVRVFLDELPGRGIGGAVAATEPLEAGYVARLAQFVSDAAAHGIYTVVTMVYVPNNAYFAAWSRAHFEPPGWSNWNAPFLTAAGQGTFAEYARQLGAALDKGLRPAAARGVLVSLQNEFFLNSSAYPFDQRSLRITLGDNRTYDMADAASRQAAADSNTNRWAELAASAVKVHLPASPVFVGMFTFEAVGKGGPNGLLRSPQCAGERCAFGPCDCRFPARPAQLAEAAGIDLLDVHIYQADGGAQALRKNLATEEWGRIRQDVPILLGEFGCNWNWQPNATACAPSVRQLQLSSCAQGFSGWLFWTYDCEEQADWYNMADDGGAIGKALLPTAHPDPCKPP